jgi:hypothetical protein
MIKNVTLIFSGVLVLAGILGFVIPPAKAKSSGAPAYNIFHIFFGVVGGAIALWGKDDSMRAFLIGFGAIDLYQAVASKLNWPPKAQFKWKPADDVLHVVIGAALVVIGIIG